MSNRNYYCSNKFKHLQIDLTSKTTYNCHAASPHNIDFDWLEQNPGNLFNTPINVFEREQMLKNQRNKSCEQNCWRAEDVGAVSPRIYQNGVEKTHVDAMTQPEIISLVPSTDCNLSCSYCCKEYSNTWRKDIVENGDYNLTNYTDTRYKGSSKDKALLEISQPKLKKTRQYRLLLKEIERLSTSLKHLTIIGGEPLLDNQLISYLEKMKLNPDLSIKIFTGMGMGDYRFKTMLEKLSRMKNILLIVSAENIGKDLEFNRFGNKWENFKKKIELIKQSNLQFKFHSTITNLSIFGFKEFYDYYKDNTIDVTFAYQPSMMAPYVLDDESKMNLKSSFNTLPNTVSHPIITSIKNSPTNLQRINTREFLLEFTKRKKLKLDIFPKSFLEWLQLENML